MRGKAHVQDEIEADAARIGFIKERRGPDFRQISWRLKCSKCPRDFTASWDAGCPPDFMIKNVRKRQWDVDYGMRPLCPDCAHKKDKAPLPKPEHQNFKPWVPPATMIFDRLLDAAELRSKQAVIPKLWANVEAAEKAIIEAKGEVRELRATASEESRLAAQQARMTHAREMKLQRIKDAQIARDAGATALRNAQLKERACACPPESAHEIVNAPQAYEEKMVKIAPTPTPKISHAVFQCLDGVFDAAKRLYKSGYTDQRVAKECGTSEDVVAYLRVETFGQLAEDPRISAMRDDLELMRMESAEVFAKLQKQMGEMASRVEQLAHAR